jgi:hypothetical protein
MNSSLGTTYQTRSIPLRKLLTFILLGLLLAAPGEVLNQILARRDLRAFRTTLFSYAILLLVAFFVCKLIRGAVKKRAVAVLSSYLLFGSFGLSVEWFLLGNAPVLDVGQMITQPGMFTYWGTLVLGPVLIADASAPAGLRRAFLLFFLIYTSCYLLVATLIPRDHGGIFLGFIIFAGGTTALNYFYMRYFQMMGSERAC